MPKIISLDFELCSTFDLRDVGAEVWTRKAATLPILCGFAIDYGPPAAIGFDLLAIALLDAPPEVVCAHDHEARLMNAVKEGAEIHAWNAAFEFAVWNNICVPRFDWPELPIERFHCTMATAANAGLPMKLDDAARAVGSAHVKDAAGHAIMQRMARPRGFEADRTPVWWHRDHPNWPSMRPKARADDEAKVVEMIKALIAYNLADVNAEREVHQRIPRMSAREREIWLVDQRMNQRGMPVDQALLTDLHAITLQEALRLSNVIREATCGAVSGFTQAGVLLKWAQARGYPLNTLGRATLEAFIAAPPFAKLDQTVRLVLETRLEASKTSTVKLRSIAAYSQVDGMARGLVQYGGAVRTLRWAGRGPQIQNFPRPIIKDVKGAIEQIRLGMDADSLGLIFGRPLDVVSSCLRGVFKAPDGFKFVVADYHAIEAIVLAWLAEFEPMLDVFRRGEDIYVFTATGVGSTNRTLGKVLRLACGYGMGAAKFVESAAIYKLPLTLEEAQTAVDEFRKANAPIVQLWHGCEAMAKKAIADPGTVYAFRKLKFRMARPDGRLAGALLMELPSGRPLVYRNAVINGGRVQFWGVNQFTRKWEEQDTYGGKLVENATQAIARDLLAEALVRLELLYSGALRATIHDEIVAMIDTPNAGILLRFLKMIMSTPPAWGDGLPLSAAGAVVDRYGKL